MFTASEDAELDRKIKDHLLIIFIQKDLYNM